MDIGRLLLGILAIFLLMAAILSTFAGTRMWIMRQMGKGTCRWCGHWLNAWRNSWGLPWGFMNVCPTCGRRQAVVKEGCTGAALHAKRVTRSARNGWVEWVWVM
jgi:hypothetical protein